MPWRKVFSFSCCQRVSKDRCAPKWQPGPQTTACSVSDVAPPVLGRDSGFSAHHLREAQNAGWGILTTSSKDVKPPTTRLMTLSWRKEDSYTHALARKNEHVKQMSNQQCWEHHISQDPCYPQQHPPGSLVSSATQEGFPSSYSMARREVVLAKTLCSRLGHLQLASSTSISCGNRS